MEALLIILMIIFIMNMFRVIVKDSRDWRKAQRSGSKNEGTVKDSIGEEANTIKSKRNDDVNSISVTRNVDGTLDSGSPSNTLQASTYADTKKAAKDSETASGICNDASSEINKQEKAGKDSSDSSVAPNNIGVEDELRTDNDLYEDENESDDDDEEFDDDDIYDDEDDIYDDDDDDLDYEDYEYEDDLDDDDSDDEVCDDDEFDDDDIDNDDELDSDEKEVDDDDEPEKAPKSLKKKAKLRKMRRRRLLRKRRQLEEEKRQKDDSAEEEEYPDYPGLFLPFDYSYDEEENWLSPDDYDDEELREIAEDRMRMHHGVSHFYSDRKGEEIVRWKGEYYHESDIIRRSWGYTCLASGASPYKVPYSRKWRCSRR